MVTDVRSKKVFVNSLLEGKVQAYLEELAFETSEVKRSSAFRNCLETMAFFWNYSCKNQLLIQLQKPNATLIAGFKKWNKLGRKIKPGEKAIKILAPHSKKEIQTNPETGEEKEITKTFFRPVSVFDVSQTTGKKLLSLDLEVPGNNLNKLLKKLISFCKHKKISVEFKELNKSTFGYSKKTKIVINSKQSINSQTNTLIHEIAHTLIHFKKNNFSKEEKEIHAEATVFIISKALKFKNKSPQYLAFHTKNKQKILESLKTISQTSREILGFLEKNKGCLKFTGTLV